MRNQIYGTWLVKEYLHREDQVSLDTSWTDYYWECTCTECGTEIVLERRRIRPAEKQQKCPTCKAAKRQRNKVATEIARLTRKIEAERTRMYPKARYDWSEIRRLHKAGNSSYAIAERLGCSQGAVINALQKMGLKAPRTNRETFSKRIRKYSSEAERRTATNERQLLRYYAKRDQKIADGTYRPRGRPRKTAH